MKKEDRIISTLFEAARTEAPKVSFEQMAQHLGQQASISPPDAAGLSTNVKQFLLKNIGLNTIILVVGAGLVYYGLRPSNPTSESSAISQLALAEDSIPSASPILPIEPSLIQTQQATLPSPSLLSEVEKKQQRKSPPLSPSLVSSDPIRDGLETSEDVEEDAIDPKVPSPQGGTKIPTTDSIPKPEPISSSTDLPTPPSVATKPNPPVKPQSSDTVLSSGFTIQDKIKIDSGDIHSTTPIVLKNTYNQDATQEFFTLLSSYGFVLKKKRHRFKEGLVHNIFLHLTHPEGLDFTLKARRFKQLEFMLYFDESDQLFGFSIRMNNNQKKEEKIISLKAKGHITQQYRY